MNDDIAPINAGIAVSDGPEKTREHADVERWRKKITQARKYDEEARKQYAKDRRYARGDSGFEVDANVVGTNIDILESFLYAKDPDVDVLPAKSCMPPSIDTVRDAAEQNIEAAGARPPEVQQAGQQAAAQAILNRMPQEDALVAGMMAENAAMEQLIQGEFDRLQKRYQRRLRDAKAFAETVEIVISRLWRDASLKPRGRRFVRSGLTIGLGVLKASWQERTAPSPETVVAINDLQSNIKLAAAKRAAMDEASGTELDELTADYERQLKALKGEAERVVARGYVVDLVAGEDFQVAPGFQIASHLDAPWNAHRIPLLKEDAVAQFDLDEETAKGATIYYARKPVMVQAKSANEQLVDNNVGAQEADAFLTSNTNADGEGGEWVMVWEIWDRDSGNVLTMIEGVKCWVKPAWQPTATTRFYPFFVYTTSEVDGQRHPQSLVTRASKLVDEYNRIGSAEAEHRRRIKPKILFLKGQIGKDPMTKIADGTTAEFVGVETTQPNVNMQTLFFPCPYPQLDPALYDRSRIIAEIERIFGVQEALAGSVSKAKTATEAEIQQGGFQARTGGRRDLLEMALLDLAQYTAEVARAHLDADDVRLMAGPDALWPEYAGAADLDSMVKIEIRAGSSGKPDTSAEREAWAQQLPLLQSSIMQIGQLRNSLPTDVADCLEKLLQITAERSGDRIDIDQLVPKAGPPPAPVPPTDPNAKPGEGAPDAANDNTNAAQPLGGPAQMPPAA